MLFIAQYAFENYRKGTHILEKILIEFIFRKEFEFLIVGHNSHNWKNFNFSNIKTFDFNVNLDWKVFLYNAADCLLIPSINENLPNVLLEAMSCGLPSIAFDSGGINDVVNESNGVLIKQSDVKQIIRTIYSLSKNRNKLLNLRRNARRIIVQKFSAKSESRRYISLYNSIINEKNKI